MSFFSKVGSFFKNTASKVSSAVKSVSSKVSSAVKSIGSKVSTAVKNIVPAVTGAVGGAVDGYLGGGIRGAVRGAIDGAVNAVKGAESEQGSTEVQTEKLVASFAAPATFGGQTALADSFVSVGGGLKTPSKMDRIVSALKQKGYNGYTTLLALNSNTMGV